jgi:hypothetical protein
MRSLQSILQAQEEARYVSRTWSVSDVAGYVYRDTPDVPQSADVEYGSQENKDRWYALEVRKVTGGKLFTPEITHEANRGYTKAIGANQHVWGHFTLHSNPEDLIQYLDRTQFTITYKGATL